MLCQRIFAIALGQEDLNDHQTLRVDPLLQLACERTVDADQPLASPPTLCRLENRALRPFLVEAAQGLYEQTDCQRGEAENRIKEQQLGLFADRTSCHNSQANHLTQYLLLDIYMWHVNQYVICWRYTSTAC